MYSGTLNCKTDAARFLDDDITVPAR